MLNAYQLGGWGMYPVTIVGLLLALAALTYASRPAKDGRVLIICVGLLTLLSGCLGTVMGFVNTMIAAAGGSLAQPVSAVLLTGFGESLYCLVQAMMLLFVGIAVTGVGAIRQWRQAAAR